MFSAIVTDTGQVTLPEEIQQQIKLVSGSQFEFVIDENGQVRIFPLNIAVETLAGILHRYRSGIEPATIEDEVP